MRKRVLTVVVTIFSAPILMAQIIEPIPFGDMEIWQQRVVKESRIIGGKSKTLFELSKGDVITKNIPFENKSSDWCTSSVMARVSGIYKGSTTVFPEAREEGGTAARLETTLENVKVLGIINISALATGTIFLGTIDEPIRDTKNPMAKLIQGIPFTKHPSFLQFDYKFFNGNNGVRIMDNGFSSEDHIAGKNAAEAVILLQERWEDSDGNIYAKRIGTGWARYSNDVPKWINNEQVEVLYGDISNHNDFKPYMGLISKNPIYTKNSKGEIVPIQEIGWTSASTSPTHLIVRFSSGYGGAYIGAPGSKMWIDNVVLGYND